MSIRVAEKVPRLSATVLVLLMGKLHPSLRKRMIDRSQQQSEENVRKENKLSASTLSYKAYFTFSSLLINSIGCSDTYYAYALSPFRSLFCNLSRNPFERDKAHMHRFPLAAITGSLLIFLLISVKLWHWFQNAVHEFILSSHSVHSQTHCEGRSFQSQSRWYSQSRSWRFFEEHYGDWLEIDTRRRAADISVRFKSVIDKKPNTACSAK